MTSNKKKKKNKPQIEAAPMAGFTDLAFRRTLNRAGIKKTWTEMVSATALVYESKKTELLLVHDRNTVVQLFGKNPKHFEQACKMPVFKDVCEININMGCPATKIFKNSEGVALMQNPQLAREIITACVQASKKPISVKMRLGSSRADNEIKQHELKTDNYSVWFAKMCEDAGASRLIVHGRYGEDGYSGQADYNAIRKIALELSIPVIANGDILSYDDALSVQTRTHADGVMVGRALVGAPWICARVKPSRKKMLRLITFHMRESQKLGALVTTTLKPRKPKHKDIDNASILEMRKHLLAYAKSLSLTRETRTALSTVTSFDMARKLIGIKPIRYN